MADVSFFAIAFRMKYINRWGLMRSSYPENLSEHSAETAILAHALCTIGNELFGKSYNADRAATLALFHDIGEVYTGDLPTPIKYFNSEIRKSYGEIEKSATEKLLSKLPENLRPTYKRILAESDEELLPIIKAADKLCALIKCAEEMKNGNAEFNSAYESTKKKIDGLCLCEVKYFMENFFPEFFKNLDQL